MKAKFTTVDVGFTKLSVVFFTLFAISAWPAFTSWVSGTPWLLFLVISALLGIKPIISYFKN